MRQIAMLRTLVLSLLLSACAFAQRDLGARVRPTEIEHHFFVFGGSDLTTTDLDKANTSIFKKNFRGVDKNLDNFWTKHFYFGNGNLEGSITTEGRGIKNFFDTLDEVADKEKLYYDIIF